MYGTIVIKGSYSTIKKGLDKFRVQLDESGNLFIICRTEYDTQNDVRHDFFDLIRYSVKAGLMYVNTIVAPTPEFIGGSLPDNVVYIVWLVRNHTSMFFNKDAIREEHIWKNVEWGHRAKNYNPKGKDPGNVWIPTEDDGQGNITAHIMLSTKDIIERLYACSKQNDKSFLVVSDSLSDKVNCPDDCEFELIETSFSANNACNESIKYVKETSTHHGAVWAKVLWGTSENMSKVPKKSVDCIVTSPPYWDLKDYFKEGQIGQESYDQYLNRLNNVWKECYNVLKDNGTFWLNINIRVKQNRVILIPYDFIHQCKEIGFHYKGILIWHKSSGIPTHDKNIVDRHEYVLVFSKGKQITLNEAIRNIADYKDNRMNGGLFWNINRKAGSVGKHYIHPAIYPNELVERILLSCTKEGDVVLDPFLGSGTTMIASITTNRNSYGFEFNEGFKELILSRIQTDIGLLSSYDLEI